MLDVRKAAVRGADVSGVLKPLDLKRFRPLISSDEGDISVEMAFSRDDENRFLLDLAIEANVVVICQRCLETMPEHLHSNTCLAVVWTDEEAAHLPGHLEPLVLTEATCNLWNVVEDELILALRPFNYHDTQDCNSKIPAFSDPVQQKDLREDKPNPFNVLGQLKPGK